MSRPPATHAIAWLLLCLIAEAARGSHQDAGGELWPASLEKTLLTRNDPIDGMINCGLWLSALPDCPQLEASDTHTIAPAPPTPHSTSGPDREGIRRDTYYFMGLQLSIVGALYFMPESVSGWSDQQKNQHHADKWWSNVSDPAWDEDEDYINYVLHPYWGAAYYVRARERGYGPQGAFWYSFLLSTLYETGVEALFEPVSIQDFFVTPIVGSWLGGYFMDWRRATQARMARTGERRFRDKALLVATDPLGNAAEFIDRKLGREAEFGAVPFVVRGVGVPGHPFAPYLGEGARDTYGLRLTLRW